MCNDDLATWYTQCLTRREMAFHKGGFAIRYKPEGAEFLEAYPDCVDKFKKL